MGPGPPLALPVAAGAAARRVTDGRIEISQQKTVKDLGLAVVCRYTLFKKGRPSRVRKRGKQRVMDVGW